MKNKVEINLPFNKIRNYLPKFEDLPRALMISVYIILYQIHTITITITITEITKKIGC